MNLAIDVLLHAGRSAVDVALYTLLPIMVLMMIVMRAPEASGALDKIVALLTPVVRPFGLTGLGDDSGQLRRVDHDTGADGGSRIVGSSARSGFAALLAMVQRTRYFRWQPSDSTRQSHKGCQRSGGLSPRPQPIGFWDGGYPAKQTRSVDARIIQAWS
jgi:hypothetical protein